MQGDLLTALEYSLEQVLELHCVCSKAATEAEHPLVVGQSPASYSMDLWTSGLDLCTR